VCLVVWRGGLGLGVGDGLCRKGQAWGWAEKVLHNKSGRCGLAVRLSPTVSPTPQACYRNCGTRRLRMGMGQCMGAWTWAEHGGDGAGGKGECWPGYLPPCTSDVSASTRGTYLGLPPEACDYWTTEPERPLRPSIDTAPRLKRCWPLGTAASPVLRATLRHLRLAQTRDSLSITESARLLVCFISFGALRRAGGIASA